MAFSTWKKATGLFFFFHSDFMRFEIVGLASSSSSSWATLEVLEIILWESSPISCFEAGFGAYEIVGWALFCFLDLSGS
jgi:hypothetical protein